jgi:hypothetical protein
MHPIQRFVDPGNSNEYFVDLRRIVMFTRHSSSDSSTIHMDPAEHDLCLHDHVADRINEAWRAYNAPRPDVVGPGLLAGWVITTTEHHTMARHDRLGVYCEAIGSERTVISTVGYIPDDVVEAVIAAHRARVGGAS